MYQDKVQESTGIENRDGRETITGQEGHLHHEVTVGATGAGIDTIVTGADRAHHMAEVADIEAQAQDEIRMMTCRCRRGRPRMYLTSKLLSWTNSIGTYFV